MKSESETDISSEIRYLLRKESNCLCADCFDSCTLFVDVDNYVFLCKSCSDIHKQLGFHIKKPLNDTFTFDEIQNLKKTDNETFNKKMMSLYQHGSSPIPFGASDLERFSFIEDKYIEKKWFSPIPNENNQSFYNRKHFDIVEEENDKTDDEQFLDSESETSEITSPNEPNFFGLHQKLQPVMCVVKLSRNELDSNNEKECEQQEETISHYEERYELNTPQNLLIKNENDQIFDDNENDTQNMRSFIQVDSFVSNERSQEPVENYYYNPKYEPTEPQLEIQKQQLGRSLISSQDQNGISHDQEFEPTEPQLRIQKQQLGRSLISSEDQNDISHNQEIAPTEPQLRIQQQQLGSSLISSQDQNGISHDQEIAPTEPQLRIQQQQLGRSLISSEDQNDISRNQEFEPSQQIFGNLFISPQDQNDISHNQEIAPSKQQFRIQQQQLDNQFIPTQDQNDISHDQEFEPTESQFRIQQLQLDNQFIPTQDQNDQIFDLTTFDFQSYIPSYDSFSDQKCDSESHPEHFIADDDAENDDFINDESKSDEILANNQNESKTSQEPNIFTTTSNSYSIQNEDRVNLKIQITDVDYENNYEISNNKDSKNRSMKNKERESFHRESARVNKKFKISIEIICVLVVILLFAFQIFIH